MTITSNEGQPVLILLPRECTDDIAEAIAKEANCCGGIAESIWSAAVAAATKDYGQFHVGACVEKKSGSQWKGRIVGVYSTDLTPIGWCVESETEIGSVQIYPEKALRLLPD